MSCRLLTPRDYTAMPWRNGRGTTTELAREDDTSGAMLWRVSRADVVEAGEFSPFPGIDRLLLLLDGAGFDLDFGPHGRVAPMLPLSPVRFSGDWATRADNVRGASRDLNVMVARGRVAADVTVHHGTPFESAFASRALFLALSGRWHLHVGDSAHAVAAEEMLVAHGEASRGNGSGTLVQIRLTFLP